MLSLLYLIIILYYIPKGLRILLKEYLYFYTTTKRMLEASLQPYSLKQPVILNPDRGGLYRPLLTNLFIYILI
jgi:hypothetical protein